MIKLNITEGPWKVRPVISDSERYHDPLAYHNAKAISCVPELVKVYEAAHILNKCRMKIAKASMSSITEEDATEMLTNMNEAYEVLWGRLKDLEKRFEDD